MKNMISQLSKRNSFFLKHLFFSLILATIVILLVYGVWYPSPIASAVGVNHIFLMLLTIDVVIGPILGFFVYKVEKITLKFDLGVIIFIQLIALIYGMFNIFQGRPSWIVYAVDRFEIVRNNEIILDKIGQVNEQFRNASVLSPQFVGMEFAKDSKTRNDDMFAELSGVSIAQRPERYVPLEQVKPQIQQRSQNFELLNQFNNKDEVNLILSKYPQATSWVPLKANAVDMVVLLDKNADVVKIVDLRPWK